MPKRRYSAESITTATGNYPPERDEFGDRPEVEEHTVPVVKGLGRRAVRGAEPSLVMSDPPEMTDQTAQYLISRGGVVLNNSNNS